LVANIKIPLLFEPSASPWYTAPAAELSPDHGMGRVTIGFHPEMVPSSVAK